MKNKSNYIGTPEKWIEFLSAWAGNTEIPSKAFKPRSLGNLPKSYIDFYLAMERLEWPKFIEIFGPDKELLPFNRINRVDSLLFFDKTAFDGAKDENDTVLELNRESTYNRDQYHSFSEKALSASYVVAWKETPIFHVGLLINPLVVTSDGEWETIYFDVPNHFSLNFPCFADAMSWLYQCSLNLHDDINERPWLDHTFDKTGASKLLFSE